MAFAVVNDGHHWHAAIHAGTSLLLAQGVVGGTFSPTCTAGVLVGAALDVVVGVASFFSCDRVTRVAQPEAVSPLWRRI